MNSTVAARRTRDLRGLLVTIVIALAVRGAWIQHAPVMPESDYLTFFTMAKAIADGVWMPESYGWVYQGAGFPTVLAPIVRLGGGVDAVRIVNMLAQVAMVGGVWFVARHLFGFVPAMTAGLAAALLPGIWAYVPLVAAESIAMALLAGILFGLTKGTGWRSALAIGAMASLLAFTRPAFLPFALVIAAVLVVFVRAPWWRRPTALAAGFVGVALPFIGLNLANDGPALPTGAAGWQTWLVNNERSTGAWFAAASRDDYPFAALGSDLEMRTAQQLLGLRFMATNPGITIERSIERHRLNWQSDDLGMFWTMDRLPRSDLWAPPPDTTRYHDVANLAYTGLLVLAVIGAWRVRHRADVVIPIVLPLAYGVAILTAAEANGRYHVIFLPLLCLVAGAALAGETDRVRIVRTLGIAGIATTILWGSGRWAAGDPDSIMAWLVLLLVLLPPVGVLAAHGPAWWTSFRATRFGRGRVLRGELAAIGAVIVLATSSVLHAAAELRQGNADVAPTGWTAYASDDRGEAILPLVLQPSDVDPVMVQVSYPDAAIVPLGVHPQAGDIAGLRRVVGNLEVGTVYVITMQIYDPQMAGDPSETLSVTMDGVAFWDAPSVAGAGEWIPVRFAWTATAETVIIDILRVIGTSPVTTAAGTPQVRTLIVFPQP